MQEFSQFYNQILIKHDQIIEQIGNSKLPPN